MHDQPRKRPTSLLLRATCLSGLILLAAVAWARLRPAALQEPPVPILPSPNAYDYYSEALDMHLALVAANPASETVDPITDRRLKVSLSKSEMRKRYPTSAKAAWIRKNRPVLTRLRQGFAYPYLQPPQRTAVVPDTYMTGMRTLARLLIIEARLKSESGDWKGASKSALDVLKIGEDVPRGGAYLTALMGYAIKALACRELNEILPHLDAEAARSVALRMEAMEKNSHSFAANLEEEKWTGLTSLKQFLGQFKPPGFVLALPNGNNSPTVGKHFLRNLTRNDILRNYCSYMDALALQMEQPYLLRKFTASPFEGTNLEIITSAYSSTRRIDWNSARSDTNVVLLRLSMALSSWQLRHGSYPKSLQELKPNYLQSLPIDPFGSGEPIRYRKIKTGYLLYSIGPNGKDDGGKPSYNSLPAVNPKSRYIVDYQSKGDFVAGVNR